MKTKSSRLTHVDRHGRIRMVDVGDKAVTDREAVARGSIAMSPKARKLITAVLPARREQLTSNCQQLGVDIGGRKKSDKPASDCEADPMACQH